MEAKEIRIGSNALLEGNNISTVFFIFERHRTFGLSDEIDPVFRNNTILQSAPGMYRDEYYEEGSAYKKGFLDIRSNARPAFEGNEIRSRLTEVYVSEDAQPDFGGGGTSRGLNTFRSNRSLTTSVRREGAVCIDIGEENTVTVYARNNGWSGTPNLVVISGADDVSCELGAIVG